MKGCGVTNYAVGKPSCGFSAATTEFDDALISRGIVTFEQAMIAKGASPSEARRIAIVKANEHDASNIQSDLNQNDDTNTSYIQNLGDGYDEETEKFSEGDKDEQFIKEYRQMRINDIKNGRKSHGYGEVLPISRPDWNREVNEASRNGLWVVVNLTRSSISESRIHNEICEKVEGIMRDLADKFVDVKFVSIPATSAIENWSAENLPTLFCYRYGKMQHQLIGVDALGGAGINCGRLEWRLAMLKVLNTDLEEDPRPDRTDRSGFTSQGTMSRLATTRGYESDDYDNVD